MSDGIRVPEHQLAAPLAHGVRTTPSSMRFTFDFTVPDETGVAQHVVVRRVHLDASAIEALVNQLNLQLNEWKMQAGQ